MKEAEGRLSLYDGRFLKVRRHDGGCELHGRQLGRSLMCRLLRVSYSRDRNIKRLSWSKDLVQGRLVYEIVQHHNRNRNRNTTTAAYSSTTVLPGVLEISPALTQKPCFGAVSALSRPTLIIIGGKGPWLRFLDTKKAVQNLIQQSVHVVRVRL